MARKIKYNSRQYNSLKWNIGYNNKWCLIQENNRKI